MFDRVVVGVDGRANGQDAIALARHLVSSGGRLTLANVHAPDAHPVSGAQPRFQDAVVAQSAELLTRERLASGVSAGLASTGASTVAEGLHRLAHKHDADLLVVGSCGHTFAGRVFLGSDTAAAMRDSSCAVAVAPKDYAAHPGTIRSIGVGYDGGAESQTALAIARRLGAECDARISLLHAVPVSAPAYAGMAAFSYAGGIEPLLQEARDQLDEIADVDATALYGGAGEMLVNFSEEVDLLILGSRQRGTMARVLLGSTGEHVAQHARCPVLVVPRSNTPQPESELIL